MPGHRTGEVRKLGITADQLGDLIERAPTRALSDGDVLVREGDVAEEVFFLRSGALSAWVDTPSGDVHVATVDQGSVIGEIPMVAGGTRSATLRAEGSVEVVAIPRSMFERWLDEHTDVADELATQARERIDRSRVAAMLTELIGLADPKLVAEIVERVTWRELEAGDVLFEQGDHSDAAYFVVSGRLRVIIDEAGEIRVREIGRGEMVGELGLLDQAPRSGTVLATRETTLARFSAELFENLTEQHPKLMVQVSRTLLNRMRKPPRRLIDQAGAVAVAFTAPVDRAGFMEVLCRAVQRHGTVIHLSSTRVDELLHRQEISQTASRGVGVPRLVEFVHEADVAHDHMVLETDDDITPWTTRSLRQVDRAVIVVSANPSDDERRHIGAFLELLDTVPHVTRMFAIVHPPDTARPSGTAELVTSWRADEIVHVREGREDDIERLGRLATGHGVGLVLSGGGARGFAHLGAYRALRELGVPVDMVGGCSMGAPLAAAIADDVAIEGMEDLAKQQFHRLLDYTLPLVSLIKAKRISRNIEAYFGDAVIEDLWRPYYCVSTNLTTSSLMVHRRGSLAAAIRASVAIPGVLPPVPLDGELLVDGGVLNNLPIETLNADGTIGTVIAVDVAPAQGPRAKSDFGLHVSGLNALTQPLRRRRNKVAYPKVSAVLLRSMLAGAVLNQRNAVKNGGVDLMIALHLPGIGLLEFERVEPAAAAGYEAARPLIEEWTQSQPWLKEDA